MAATTTHRWAPWLAVAIIVLGFANFFAFLIESAALGGDALNGHVTNGHYYVASHGILTEVSQAVWTVSRIHAVVTLVSWPLVMLAMAFLLFRFVFPFMMAGKAPGQASERVMAIRASGVSLWQGWPGGVAGGVNATRWMLGAAVYPGGIVVTPRFMPPYAIRADEIRSVRFGRRLVTPTVEVEHAGTDITSPLVIYGGPDSPQALALLSLASRDAGAPPRAVGGPTWGSAPTPSSPAPGAHPATGAVPGPMRALSVFGLVVAAVMAVAGIVVVVPSFGVFGLVWTGMAVLILVINARRFVRRGW